MKKSGVREILFANAINRRGRIENVCKMGIMDKQNKIMQ